LEKIAANFSKKLGKIAANFSKKLGKIAPNFSKNPFKRSKNFGLSKPRRKTPSKFSGEIAEARGFFGVMQGFTVLTKRHVSPRVD
jgi:hypothetical protein